MNNKFFILYIAITLIFSVTQLNAEEISGVEFSPTGQVIVNGQVIEDATVMMTEDGDVLITSTDGSLVPLDGNPLKRCAIAHNRNIPMTYCMDRCPTSYKCNYVCNECEKIPKDDGPNNCKMNYPEDGICYDDCPWGFACDSNCKHCEEVPDLPPLPGDKCILYHTYEIRHCIDFCPPGTRCDSYCDSCESIANKDCYWDSFQICNDSCPEGQRCSGDCEHCVIILPPEPPQPPNTCKYDDEEEVCKDTCPDDKKCDSDCKECVVYR